jgi:hypothetical protein
VGHGPDSNVCAAPVIHKLHGLLWKCGKLNFRKLRLPRPWTPLKGPRPAPRFLLAPSTGPK